MHASYMRKILTDRYQHMQKQIKFRAEVQQNNSKTKYRKADAYQKVQPKAIISIANTEYSYKSKKYNFFIETKEEFQLVKES